MDFDKILRLIKLLLSDNVEVALNSKYPFAASEILGCESSNVLDILASEVCLLDELFGYLQQIGCCIGTLGYFSKCVVALLAKQYENTMKYMVKFNIITRLLCYLEYKSICDILLIVLCSKNEGLILERDFILKSLILGLRDEDCSHNCKNAILVCLSASHDECLHEFLFSRENIDYFNENLTSPSEVLVSNSLEILTEILKKLKIHEMKSELRETPYKNYSVFIKTIENLSTIISASPTATLATPFKQQIFTVKSPKLNSVKLLRCLIELENEDLLPVLLQYNTSKLTTNLFFSHPETSFLHTEYLHLTQTILACSFIDIQIQLFASGLIKQLIANPPQGQGNSGHIVKLSNMVVAHSEKCPDFKVILRAHTGWEGYHRNYLVPATQLQTGKLCSTNAPFSVKEVDQTVPESFTNEFDDPSLWEILNDNELED